jgi:hypothetical protein
MAIVLGGTESLFTFDRVLATVAIVLGAAGIWRAEFLFERLNKRADKMTEEFLRSATTIVVSYASFTRALLGVELLPTELSKDGAFALLTSFYLQQTLHRDKFTPGQLSELRKLTREQVEKGARDYAEMLVKGGLGKMKDGLEFNPDLR